MDSSPHEHEIFQFSVGKSLHPSQLHPRVMREREHYTSKKWVKKTTRKWTRRSQEEEDKEEEEEEEEKVRKRNSQCTF